MSINLDELQSIGQRRLIGCWEHTPTIMTEGEGCIIRDITGKEYLDCTAQAWTLSVGHSHPRVIGAVKDQIEKLANVFFAYRNVPMLMLAEKLAQINPEGLNKILFGLCGSTAIEGAMHLAMRYTGGQDFVTFYNAYHGRTFTTIGMSYTQESFVQVKKGLEKFVPKPIRVPSAYCYRCRFGLKYPTCNLLCAKFVETALQHAADTKVAGVMLEPIQANGGHIVPPPGYFQEIRRICDQYDVPLIFDEIQTGMGRCGKMFAGEIFDVIPDIMVIGKGLGAGFPITAVVTKEKYAHLEQGEWGFTHSGSPFACAAALAAIDVLIEEKLIENAQRMGKIFMDGLTELAEKYPIIGDVRGKGLMIGIEMVKDRESKEPAVEETQEIVSQAMERGVLFGKSGVGLRGGNVVKIKPPLCITKEQAGQALNVLEDVLKEVQS